MLKFKKVTAIEKKIKITKIYTRPNKKKTKLLTLRVRKSEMNLYIDDSTLTQLKIGLFSGERAETRHGSLFSRKNKNPKKTWSFPA